MARQMNPNPQNHYTNPWLEEEVKKLRELIEVKRFTAGQASKVLNRTRNSIISKCRHLNIVLSKTREEISMRCQMKAKKHRRY